MLSSAGRVAQAGKEAAGQTKDGSITGSFDPTALERGAKALKEIDGSTNAAKAFEVTKMQEMSKQKDAQMEIEKQQTQRAELQLRHRQVDGDEQRKTMSHKEEQERRTSQYKTQLESELYQHKLEDQQKQNEQWLQQQHEQFMRHEDLRKKNQVEIEEMKLRAMREQAALDRETASARAAAEGEAKSKEFRENMDVRVREMRATQAENMKAMEKRISMVFEGLGSAAKTMLEDKAKMTALVTGVGGLALAIYGARAGTKVAGNLVERNMSKPPLVRDTSRWSWNRNLLGMFAGQSATGKQVLDKIVLEKELSERLHWTSNCLINTKANGTPFRHVLLHGPPGTGKTLFARTLAKQSGLDYAIMSGGDIGPLGKDAVDEVNKLFQWANTSKKGMLLFIDEADAFLRKGRQDEGNMSENARNVLSAFLHHTGTETDKFCVVLATNVKDILDRAVMDRIDESFLFPLPADTEREQLVKMFMDQHIFQPTKAGKQIEVDPEINEQFMKEMALRMNGFSGRQIAKTVLAFQTAVFGSGTNKLTKGLAEAVLDWRLANYDQDVDTVERKAAEKLAEKADKLGTY